MGPRAQPERTCLACLHKGPKGTLLRVVRTAKGIHVDPAGKQPGRGAYVHREKTCVEASLLARRLARALRVVVTPEEAARLRTEMDEELEAT